MSENSLTDNLLESFDAALMKLYFELNEYIYEIDVLDKKELEKCITLFNKRLVILQHDFLTFIREKKFSSPNEFNFNIPSNELLPSILGRIETGGLTDLLIDLIPPATIYATPIDSWSLLWGLVGIFGAIVASAAGIVVAVIAVIIGLVVGFGIAVVLGRPRRRVIIRSKILNAFDQAKPKLREWAKKQIAIIVKPNDIA